MTVSTKTFWFHLTAHTVKIIQEIIFIKFPVSFCPSFKKTNHTILGSHQQENCSNMLSQSFTVTLGVCFLGKIFFLLLRYFLLSISCTTANCLLQIHTGQFGIRLPSPQSAAHTEMISFLSPCYSFENRTLKRKGVLCWMFPKGSHRFHAMPRQAPGIVKHRFFFSFKFFFNKGETVQTKCGAILTSLLPLRLGEIRFSLKTYILCIS